MSYNERLNQLIEDSGLKLVDIEQKCNELGVNVKAGYLAVLKNSPKKYASDENSIAIAKACGAKDENILVIEHYLEIAPPVILKTLELITETMVQILMLVTSNDFTEADKEVIKNSINNMQLADFISFINTEEAKQSFKKSYNSNNVTTIKNDDSFKIINTLSEPLGIQISDDTMQPTLHKGDRVNIEILPIDELKNNDIVIFFENSNKKKSICRMVYFLNDEKTLVNMIPLSNTGNAKAIVYDIKKITIVGKVTRIIRTL